MELKRFIINKLILFFMLSALIAAAVAIIGMVFDGGASLSYGALLKPIEYAALCMLPTLVTYSKRELSAKAMLVRKAIMLLLLEGVMLFIAFKSDVIDTGRPTAVIVIAASVLVIFVLANGFMWLKDSAEAKKLNRELERFRERNGRQKK